MYFSCLIETCVLVCSLFFSFYSTNPFELSTHSLLIQNVCSFCVEAAFVTPFDWLNSSFTFKEVDYQSHMLYSYSLKSRVCSRARGL